MNDDVHARQGDAKRYITRRGIALRLVIGAAAVLAGIVAAVQGQWQVGMLVACAGTLQLVGVAGDYFRQESEWRKVSMTGRLVIGLVACQIVLIISLLL